MRIFIIGAGAVGQAVGRRWLDIGHDVFYGLRDPLDPRYAALPAGRKMTVDSVHNADVIVVATPWSAALYVVSTLSNELRGRIVIDCTNPLTRGPHGLALAFGHDSSGAEELARRAPGAHVFKTLNQTGAENIADAGTYHPRPVMFVAGDDASGKARVLDLVGELAFEAVDAGPLVAARLLEPLAMLWIELALKRSQGRTMAFALVRQP